MFADEARFGRIKRPRPCWAPTGTRPEVASRLHSRIHLFVRRGRSERIRHLRLYDHADIEYGVLPGLPRHSRRESLPGRIFFWCSTAPPTIAAATSRRSNNISLLFLPPYSPELNPKENLRDEIREKIFKNYALKSIDAVRAKLKQAILYIERNPKTVNPSRPSPTSGHSDVEMV